MNFRFLFTALLSVLLLAPVMQTADAAPKKALKKKVKRRQASAKKTNSYNYRVAAQNSLRALKELQSAVGVGTTFVDYSRRLVDAKIIVDKNIQAVPMGQLKNEITQALKDYVTARTVWDLSTGDSSEKMLAQFYESEGDSMQNLWARASQHIAKAEQFLK